MASPNMLTKVNFDTIRVSLLQATYANICFDVTVRIQIFTGEGNSLPPQKVSSKELMFIALANPVQTMDSCLSSFLNNPVMGLQNGNTY